MTADEMFWELGYELEWSNGRDFHYRQGIYTIVIHLDGYGSRGVYKMRDWRMTPEEILACAQLIREMEESE